MRECGPPEILGQCGGQLPAGLVALVLLGGAPQQLAVLFPAAIHLPGGKLYYPYLRLRALDGLLLHGAEHHAMGTQHVSE